MIQKLNKVVMDLEKTKRELQNEFNTYEIQDHIKNCIEVARIDGAIDVLSGIIMAELVKGEK